MIKFKNSEQLIKGGDGSLKGSRATMIDFSRYKIKSLNTAKIKPMEYFHKPYAEKVFESEHVCTPTKKLRTILYAK